MTVINTITKPNNNSNDSNKQNNLKAEPILIITKYEVF